MLGKTKVEFLPVPIFGVEVTPVFHGLSCHSKQMIAQANIAILQRDKYITKCENLKLLH